MPNRHHSHFFVNPISGDGSMSQGKKQGGNSGGQQQKKKKTDKRQHRMTTGQLTIYSRELTERKLRHTLRSCGPVFAREWAKTQVTGDAALVRLSKERTKVGELAKKAMRPVKA